MKLVTKSIFVLGAALLMLAPAFAGTQKKATFKLEQPAMVAGVKLMPGHYTLQWQADASKTPVNILLNKKTVVSTTAMVVNKKDPYGSSTALDFKTAKNGTMSLSEIYLPKESLVFSQ